MIALGVFLFGLIAGGEDSLYGAVKTVWEAEIASRSVFP
jgi:hypothetical protein